MDVHELTRDQLNELKQAYFWGDETMDLVPDDAVCPEDIPDEIIFAHWEGTVFVEDDFFSTIENIPVSLPF